MEFIQFPSVFLVKMFFPSTSGIRNGLGKERLIDGLVKAIFDYDDYIKLILTFDDKPITIPTSDEIEYMANSSDIQSSASPTTKNHPLWMVFYFFNSNYPQKTSYTAKSNTHNKSPRMCLNTLFKLSPRGSNYVKW